MTVKVRSTKQTLLICVSSIFSPIFAANKDAYVNTIEC
jgi:hypothetical protein